MRNNIVFVVVSLMAVVGLLTIAPNASAKGPAKTQWFGKRVAFLGDSMTDKQRVGTTCVYWEYLEKSLGIKPLVYGINGRSWNDIDRQAQQLKDEQGDNVDAIMILAGTNDFNGSIKMGSFFTEDTLTVDKNGKMLPLRHRNLVYADSTFCGRLNIALQLIKTIYPNAQVVMLTPIHRGYAKFGKTNVQPDDSYANKAGLFIDDYVEAILRAGEIWSVPVIDLFGKSGIVPNLKSQDNFVHDAVTDRLHPNAVGDKRMAETIRYQLLALPAEL
jgi:lysophospholipase L1-like esterase